MFDKTMVQGSMAVIATALIWVLSVSSVTQGQDVLTLTATGAGSVTIPIGYEWTNVTVQCWGGGGGGSSGPYGQGGGGGAYAFNTYAAIVPGTYDYYVGPGGQGGVVYINGSQENGSTGGSTIWNFGGAQDIYASGGGGGNFNGLGGAGGLVLAGSGYPGGSGGYGGYTEYAVGSGGGGGGSGGPSGSGGNGGLQVLDVSAGSGGIGYGGGGSGGFAGNGNAGGSPGGGGGGGGYYGGGPYTYNGGAGANGEIIVTYTPACVGTWSASSGGSWGTLTTNFGTNWGGAGYNSPGLDPSFPSSDSATLGSSVASGTATVTLDGGSPSLAALTFSNSAASYVIASGSGGTLHLNGGTTVAVLTDSAGAHCISAPVALDTSAIVTVMNPGDTLAISGAISGNGSLTKLGRGTLVLSGGNTYTGSTAINAGTLTAGAAETPGVSGPFGVQAANAAGTIVFGGGTLQYSTANQFDYSGRFSTGGNQPISVDTNGQTVTFATAIQGMSTSLTLNDSQGTGKLILAGSNSYSGGTTVISGTLQGNTASLQGNIADSAALVFNQTTAGTFAGSISGSGSLAVTGGGPLTLPAADTFAAGGGVVVTQGALVLPFGLNHGGQGITLASGGTLEAAVSVTRAIAGNGTLIATNDLMIGKSSQSGQFNQGGAPGVGGTLNIGGNALVILSADTAILGSQTNIGAGGDLMASHGVQLGNPTSVDATKILTATGTAEINANFVNNGLVNGPTGGGQELIFNQAVTGAGSTTGNVEYAASYRPSNSPDAVSVQNVLLDPTSTLIMELDGTTPGSGYDQLDISGLATLNGTLVLTYLDDFSPSVGDSFEILEGRTTGEFALTNFPSLSNGLSWNTTQLYTNGTISVTPEPSSLALLATGLFGLLGYGWRRRRLAKRAAAPIDDAPATLSFPPLTATQARRRAA
jgi:autotransporter-associated beta strand protein